MRGTGMKDSEVYLLNKDRSMQIIAYADDLH